MKKDNKPVDMKTAPLFDNLPILPVAISEEPAVLAEKAKKDPRPSPTNADFFPVSDEEKQQLLAAKAERDARTLDNLKILSLAFIEKAKQRHLEAEANFALEQEKRNTISNPTAADAKNAAQNLLERALATSKIPNGYSDDDVVSHAKNVAKASEPIPKTTKTARDLHEQNLKLLGQKTPRHKVTTYREGVANLFYDQKDKEARGQKKVQTSETDAFIEAMKTVAEPTETGVRRVDPMQFMLMTASIASVHAAASKSGISPSADPEDGESTVAVRKDEMDDLADFDEPVEPTESKAKKPISLGWVSPKGR